MGGFLLVMACEHEGIETDEFFVCRKCGLVPYLYLPDVDWYGHSIITKEYKDSDRLLAVDRAAKQFFEKTGLKTRSFDIILQRLRAMKMNAGFKSLNYPIAITSTGRGRGSRKILTKIAKIMGAIHAASRAKHSVRQALAKTTP